MNTKKILTLFSAIVSFAVSQTARADTSSADSNGLYYVTSHETAPAKRNANEATVNSYEKADIQILKAHVYSVNNSNTDFQVYINTSHNPFGSKPDSAPKPMALRIGSHTYSCEGWGGNTMEFAIHNQDEAKIAAKWLSVDCTLRTPPNYKFSAQFVPAQSEFRTNEPVLVKFVMTNLDDKTITFEEVGSAVFQFAFQATLNGRSLPNKVENNPMQIFEGRIGLVNLEPGKEFDRQADLKEWFVFDKAGTYKVHGSYHLKCFNKSGNPAEAYQMWNQIWSDNASADFTVIVK
jgi:hypothetical protein